MRFFFHCLCNTVPKLIANALNCSSGVDYLEFLELNVFDTVVPDTQGLQTGDYFSDTIYVDIGIPIGAREQLTTELYVRAQQPNTVQCFH